MRGLVKVYGLKVEGKSTTFIGVPAGVWFGEGALLKSERRLYDAVACDQARSLTCRATRFAS
jgi:CRP-like cAMP-binding protein